jgi:putative CRISPR-associated protein (TIGR02620 family)
MNSEFNPIHEPGTVIVVTRHPALVEYLREQEIICDHTPVFTGNVTAHGIAGCHVIGVLPMHMAAHAASITEVTLDIPYHKRGHELSLSDIYECERGIHTYTVRREEFAGVRHGLINDDDLAALADLPDFALLKLREAVASSMKQ